MGRGLQARSAERLYGAELGDRYVDLRVQLKEWGDSDECIVEVGGRWDRTDRRWIDGGRECAVWRVHPGQYHAAYWFAGWLRAHIAGKRVVGSEDVYTLLATGGRRGGKSDFAVKALGLFSLALTDRISFAVSPVQEEYEELRRALDGLFDSRWYQFLDSEDVYRFWNGSSIALLSGYNPASLKRGRVDLALLNEGQRLPEKAYTMVRAPVADTSGLVVITANPPDEPKGRWVMDMHDRAQAGSPTVRLFEFDRSKNPTIDQRALDLMSHDVGEDEYRREVLGEFLPIGDVVFYAWSDRLCVRDVPDGYVDITRAYTKRYLGRTFDYVVGADFQRSPYMAAAVFKVYLDPDDADELPLLWVVDEVVRSEADEDELIDGLEAAGYDGLTCAVIGDASGEWQDAERTRGRGSFDWFRKRGWKFIYPPDAKMNKNPEIVERCKVGNALLKSHSGRRRLFSVPSNRQTNRAMKLWEMRNGAPHRRSEFAHQCDAVTYVCWRFFPRRQASGKAGYASVKRLGRRRTFARF